MADRRVPRGRARARACGLRRAGASVVPNRSPVGVRGYTRSMCLSAVALNVLERAPERARCAERVRITSNSKRALLR
eukprot:1476284-Prymnesium_polylepis.1